MALFELLAAIFSLSTLISLMGKRRATSDEAEPSCPTRSRKKMGTEVSTSAERERRSKRDLDPWIPIERSLQPGIRLAIWTYPMMDMLLKNGRGPIFEGNTHASEGIVRAFYAHIWNPLLEPHQFTIPLGREEALVNVDMVAQIMGIERGVVCASEKNLANERDRNHCMHFLYSRLARWK